LPITIIINTTTTTTTTTITVIIIMHAEVKVTVTKMQQLHCKKAVSHVCSHSNSNNWSNHVPMLERELRPFYTMR